MSRMKFKNRASIFVMVFWPFSQNRWFSLFLDWLKYLIVILIVSVVICPLTYLSSGVYYMCCVNVVSQLKLSVMRYRYYGLIAGRFGEKWKWIGFFFSLNCLLLLLLLLPFHCKSIMCHEQNEFVLNIRQLVSNEMWYCALKKTEQKAVWRLKFHHLSTIHIHINECWSIISACKVIFMYLNLIWMNTNLALVRII